MVLQCFRKLSRHTHPMDRVGWKFQFSMWFVLRSVVLSTWGNWLRGIASAMDALECRIIDGDRGLWLWAVIRRVFPWWKMEIGLTEKGKWCIDVWSFYGLVLIANYSIFVSPSVAFHPTSIENMPSSSMQAHKRWKMTNQIPLTYRAMFIY